MEKNLNIKPIGYVSGPRLEAEDDFWGNEVAVIKLTNDFDPTALAGLDQFSHAEILFFFHKVDTSKIVSGARHPRNNKDWPLVGIFAQRGKNRPNCIGSTICRILKVEGTSLFLTELDAIDGTPILDIKPIMQEFLPRNSVKQPKWSSEIMTDYWKAK